MLVRFRETIPTVKFVSSSEIQRINFGFLTEITIFVTEITILFFFQKLEFLGSYRYQTMEMNIQMFTYFDIYVTKNNINYPFGEISIFQNDWNTTTEKKK